MKISKLVVTSLSTFVLFGSLTITPNANAGHIMVTTCTNSCVTTTNTANGTTSTADCCGGMVTTVIHPAHAPNQKPKPIGEG